MNCFESQHLTIHNNTQKKTISIILGISFILIWLQFCLCIVFSSSSSSSSSSLPPSQQNPPVLWHLPAFRLLRFLLCQKHLLLQSPEGPPLCYTRHNVGSQALQNAERMEDRTSVFNPPKRGTVVVEEFRGEGRFFFQN